MKKAFKEKTTREKIKVVSKYVVNILNMINVIFVGLAEIWGFNSGKVSATIVLLAGAISAYLIHGKLWSSKNKKEEE